MRRNYDLLISDHKRILCYYTVKILKTVGFVVGVKRFTDDTLLDLRLCSH